MYDADAIEAINFEQLVTATDRLLLRGRTARRRPSVPSLASTRGSSVRTAAHPALARGTYPRLPRVCEEQTSLVRPAPSARAQVFACTVVIPTLVGIAVGLAALL